MSTADPDLEIDFKNTSADRDASFRPGKVLIIQDSDGSAIPDNSRRGGVMAFVFDQMVTFSGFTIVDDATISVTADGGAIDIGTFSVALKEGYDIFCFAAVGGITSLRFDYNGDSGAIDNIMVSAVPVLAGLPLMLAGLGAFAALKRRRKTAAS
jgi:hypothetical protein